MIRHCVFVRYRGDFDRPARQQILADLARLTMHLRGMRRVEGGPNVSPEGLGKGFDDGFIVDFDDAAARDAYLVHPEHRAIGARIVAAAEGGADGIFVFDMEMPG